MSQKMDLQVGDDAGRVGGGDGLVICGWRGQEGGGERGGRWICVGVIWRWMRGKEGGSVWVLFVGGVVRSWVRRKREVWICVDVICRWSAQEGG